MDKGIRIGTVAKIIGISPELLRHYERKKVVIPFRVDKSGYRYYSRRNISHLIKARFLLSLGFSISEVVNHNSVRYSNSTNINDLISTIEKHRKDLRQKIEREQRLLKILDDYRDRVELIPQNTNEFRIEQSPEMFFLKFSDRNDEIEETVMDETKRWIELFPITRYSFICKKKNIQNNNPKNSTIRGFIISAADAGANDISEKEGLIRYLPSRLSVHTVSSCKMSQNVSSHVFQSLASYAFENGLEIDGDGVGIWIANVKEQDNTDKYFDLWIPVRQKTQESNR